LAVSPGGRIYVASFSGYTTGTVLALGTTAAGASGDALSCWHTTGSNPSYQCPSSATNRIASPTALAIGPWPEPSACEDGARDEDLCGAGGEIVDLVVEARARAPPPPSAPTSLCV
jgi:hypothetical protein